MSRIRRLEACLIVLGLCLLFWICRIYGLDLGDVRLPLKSISAEGKKDILARIEALGVIEP